MSDYVISCCSTADLSKEYFEEIGVHWIPFHYMLDGVSYPDDLGQSISFEDFYHRLDTGSESSTSQVNAEKYIAYFKPFLEEGKDIIHVALSSGISGSYNSAMIAKADLEEEYPERRIYVIDSLCASSGFGLLMSKMAEQKKNGMSLEELKDWTEDNKLRLNHWFFSTDLKFYVKGGRVSKTSGFVGNLLNICPLLNVDFVGKLIPREKIRTKRKVIARIVDKMMELADNGENYDEDCFISNSGCREDAEAVRNLIEERFPKMVGRVKIFSIGTTIGSHTGPGTVALFFWGKRREN